MTASPTELGWRQVVLVSGRNAGAQGCGDADLRQRWPRRVLRHIAALELRRDQATAVLPFARIPLTPPIAPAETVILLRPTPPHLYQVYQ